MGFLIQSVSDAAAFVYVVCGLIAIYQLYQTWNVRARRRQAIFSLEREKATGDLYNIFISALAILLVMGATYFISTTLAQAVEPIMQDARAAQPADAIALMPTPTNTPLPVTPTPTATPFVDTPAEETQPQVVVQPVAPTAEAVPEPEPAPAPAVAPALCPDGRSAIVSPGNGAVVSGQVAIVGTARHDQFDFYKLEYAPGANAGQGFAYFDGGLVQVNNGLLGNLNSAGLPNGVYTIQLIVVDTTGNYPPPCSVTLTIQN